MNNESRSDETQNESTAPDTDSPTQSAVTDIESKSCDQNDIRTPFQSGESSSIRSGSRSERLQDHFELSPKQWDFLVSFLLFLPYPVFTLLIITQTLNNWSFIIITLIYSVIAMILNFYF